MKETKFGTVIQPWEGKDFKHMTMSISLTIARSDGATGPIFCGGRAYYAYAIFTRATLFIARSLPSCGVRLSHAGIMSKRVNLS